MKDKSNNIIPFVSASESRDDEIIINHGMRTLEAAKTVSDFIKGLPLSAEQNDTLIHLLKDHLLIAEHEAFIQGFVACMDEIQGCGLSNSLNKIVKSEDLEI